MALPPERPLADPLLEPDVGPRDVTGAPVRAPIGNSIRTLLLLVTLLVAGVVVWWVRRPSDLTERIGGREWIIVEVDGAPAVNEAGTTSTFVLDGTREIRGMVGCRTASGRWEFDTSTQSLSVEWVRQTSTTCAADHPTTYVIDGGGVRLDGAAMTIDDPQGTTRSIAVGGLPVASADEMAGTWTSGPSTIEIGPRGLLRVDGCTGSWMATDGGIATQFDEAELQRGDCALHTIWTTGAVVVPVRFEDALYLHGEARPFPLDRNVRRLDLVDEQVRLDGP